jgi:Tfp pilus assembly protein PilP
MKLTNTILATCLAFGTAWAQNPGIITTAKAKLNTVQQQQTASSNAALAATQGQSSVPKPAAGGPAITPTSAKPGSYAAQLPQANSKKSAVTIVAVPKKDPAKPLTKAAAAKAETKPTVPAAAEAKPEVAVEDSKNPADGKKDDPKTISMAGRRDPFISPVVNHMNTGSGCSTGKRCLAVDQIALTGIVKSDTGMIAVVVNAMNKAYFLRENDPVFNGYVVRITGDSIIFNETIQDKLGKSFTREVTKKITTPAV